MEPLKRTPALHYTWIFVRGEPPGAPWKNLCEAEYKSQTPISLYTSFPKSRPKIDLKYGPVGNLFRAGGLWA